MAVGPGLHSRVVAILKVSLPLIAVGLLAGLFLSPPDQPSTGNGLVFSAGDIEALGSGFSLSNATFNGTTAGDDRFHFTTALVVPDAAPPTRAAITDLSGDIALKNGPVLTVSATAGEYLIDAKRLDLGGDVQLSSSDGYKIDADRTTIDLRAGSLVAGDHVLTNGPLGEIRSQSLTIMPADATGEARRFSFAGGVRVLYDPPDAG